MPIQSFGDRAQNFATLRATSALRQALSRHASELTTGLAADVSAHLSGRTDQLSRVSHDLSRLAAFDTVITETRHRQTLIQTALGSVQSGAVSLANSALTITSGSDPSEISRAAQEARHTMGSAISALNLHDQGMPLFSGTLQGTAALAPAEIMLADLEAAIIASGATDLVGVQGAVSDWFDTPGGGFETTGYLGNTSDATPRPIGDGVTIPAGPRADHSAIRGTLKGIAIVALADSLSLPLGDGDRRTMIGAGQLQIRSGADQTIALQATVGLQQQRLETAATRNAAESDSLTRLRSAATSVDPFEAASKLEEVQTQLEMNYTLTARLSRLSLLDYLR